MVDTDRKSAEARPGTENLRLQIERSVNEDGAGGEDTAPHASTGSSAMANHKQLRDHCF